MAKQTTNKSTKNKNDQEYQTVKEGTDSMGGPVYLFKDEGGYWVEHWKNSGEDIITDYLDESAADEKFNEECNESVWR